MSQRTVFACAIFAGIVVIVSCTRADEAPKPPEKTDSRAPYVHRLNLVDEFGRPINPAARHPEPYSPLQTCGTCHDVNTIGCGWHFGATDPNTRPGRRGEPWLLVDGTTRTQLPLSYRIWPGTHRPNEVGMSQWSFVQTFGRHLPGGYPTSRPADDPAATPKPRWNASGRLEIDCMACHSADNAYDHEARAHQLKQENFRWAPTMALGLGSVGPTQTAKKIPEDFDRRTIKPDDPDFELPGPRLVYERSRFDHEGRVLFNITRRIAPERCYACHTVAPVDPNAPGLIHRDNDVHLAAGLSCVDCHRNSMDHRIVRGYEGERLVGDSRSPALSCRECHMGSPTDKGILKQLGGRLRAPYPLHKGLPPIHFQKLSCTACHSGPWPEEQLHRIHTSMAHALGLKSRYRGAATPPYIVEPVFLLDHQQQIAPHRLVWPSFWGNAEGSLVRPLPLPAVRSAAKGILPDIRSIESGVTPPLTREQVTQVLRNLAESSVGSPVFVCEGMLYRADGSSVVDETAKPYAWPLAHDVRPAAQSLGVRGCADCHSADSPIFFGKVTPVGMAGMNVGPTQTMHQMRGQSGTVWKAWALSFRGRTVFVWLLGAIAAVLAAVIALYALHGLGWVCAGRPRPEQPQACALPRFARLDALAWAATLLGAMGLGASGFAAWLAWGGPMHGWLLIGHCVAAPLLGLGLLVVAVRWSDGNRLATTACGVCSTLYWLMLCSGLVVVTSALAGLLKFAGTPRLIWLYEVHRLSTVAFTVFLVLYFGGLLYLRNKSEARAIGQPSD